MAAKKSFFGRRLCTPTLEHNSKLDGLAVIFFWFIVPSYELLKSIGIFWKAFDAENFCQREIVEAFKMQLP